MLNTLHEYSDIVPSFGWALITQNNLESFTYADKQKLLYQAREVARLCRVRFINSKSVLLSSYGKAIKEIDKLVLIIDNMRVVEEELAYYR